MEHLAREKISAQQRLATLRRDGSCVLPLYDNTNHSQSLTYHLHHCTTSSALSTTATSSSSALSATTTTATGATTIVTPAHGNSRHPSAAAAAAAVTSVVASNATHLTTSSYPFITITIDDNRERRLTKYLFDMSAIRTLYR